MTEGLPHCTAHRFTLGRRHIRTATHVATIDGASVFGCTSCVEALPMHSFQVLPACEHDWRRAMDEQTKWLGEMCLKCKLTRDFPE